MRKLLTILVAFTSLSLSGCGYNAIQKNDETVTSSWSEVVNQYQRRADLIPNIVNSVKGFAEQEKSVLLGVTEARSKVGSVQVGPRSPTTPPRCRSFRLPSRN